MSDITLEDIAMLGEQYAQDRNNKQGQLDALVEAVQRETRKREAEGAQMAASFNKQASELREGIAEDKGALLLLEKLAKALKGELVIADRKRK